MDSRRLMMSRFRPTPLLDQHEDGDIPPLPDGTALVVQIAAAEAEVESLAPVLDVVVEEAALEPIVAEPVPEPIVEEPVVEEKPKPRPKRTRKPAAKKAAPKRRYTRRKIY